MMKFSLRDAFWIVLIIAALAAIAAALSSTPARAGIYGNAAYIGPPILTPNGAYLGASCPSGCETFEGSINRTLAIVEHYEPFDLSAIGSDSDIVDDLQHGRTPIISWGCGGFKLDAIAAGTYDTSLINSLLAVKALGVPVFIRPMWEM